MYLRNVLLSIIGFVIGCSLSPDSPGVLAKHEPFDVALDKSILSQTTKSFQLELYVKPTQESLNKLLIETIINSKGDEITKNMKVEGDGSKFIANFDKKVMMEPGLYKMKVSGKDSSTSDIVSKVILFKVVQDISITRATINDLEMQYRDKLIQQTMSSGSRDALFISVELQNQLDKSPSVAQQMFLHFIHEDKETEAYFPLLAEDSKSKPHTALLNFAALSKKFSYKSGVYNLRLLIGDVTFTESFIWDLGVMELVLGASPPLKHLPLYKKPLLHESDTTLHALPEIYHVMRTPESRPPIVVSIVFAAISLVPLGGFVLYMARLKVNIRRLFDSSVFFYGIGFLASLACIFGLFIMYWIKLTMFSTLAYLSAIGCVSLWFGLLTLRRLVHMDVTKVKTN